jgi:hypothetical protein
VGCALVLGGQKDTRDLPRQGPHVASVTNGATTPGSYGGRQSTYELLGDETVGAARSVTLSATCSRPRTDVLLGPRHRRGHPRRFLPVLIDVLANLAQLLTKRLATLNVPIREVVMNLLQIVAKPIHGPTPLDGDVEHLPDRAEISSPDVVGGQWLHCARPAASGAADSSGDRTQR